MFHFQHEIMLFLTVRVVNILDEKNNTQPSTRTLASSTISRFREDKLSPSCPTNTCRHSNRLALTNFVWCVSEKCELSFSTSQVSIGFPFVVDLQFSITERTTKSAQTKANYGWKDGWNVMDQSWMVGQYQLSNHFCIHQVEGLWTVIPRSRRCGHWVPLKCLNHERSNRCLLTWNKMCKFTCQVNDSTVVIQEGLYLWPVWSPGWAQCRGLFFPLWTVPSQKVFCNSDLFQG